MSDHTRQPVYQGRIVNLGIERGILPNGAPFELEVIRHSGASAIVPLLSDGRVVLIRQFRHAAGGFILELPAGRLEPGEAPEACAARELQEETGYVAGKLEALHPMFTTPGFTDEVIHLFLATELTAGPAALEEDEVIERVVVPLEEALAMVVRGEVMDGKTIAGLVVAAGKRGLLMAGRHPDP